MPSAMTPAQDESQAGQPQALARDGAEEHAEQEELDEGRRTTAAK